MYQWKRGCLIVVFVSVVFVKSEKGRQFRETALLNYRKVKKERIFYSPVSLTPPSFFANTKIKP